MTQLYHVQHQAHQAHVAALARSALHASPPYALNCHCCLGTICIPPSQPAGRRHVTRTDPPPAPPATP
eukprot:361235-Chlamydomonas_euryale.AAC.6